MNRPPIERAQDRLTTQVMEWPGVAGTMIGECEGEPCLKVLVESATDELRRKIPTEFDGYGVEIVVSGEIRALE